MSELESVMENNLIAQLTTGISQWTYRKDITSEEALWANFRQKLNQNNQAVLNGVSITDEEFSQIKNYVLEQAQTPYKAALWLSGENGEAVIPLVREDASKGTIHLFAVSRREIAGGRSCYEVINQYVSAKEGADDRERRFDVTLLINGMPMIQIELKNQNHPVDPDPTIDIEYELETIRIETIDYRYLMTLIQKHIPDEDQLIVEEIQDENIEKYIQQLSESNPALAEIIKAFWEDMKKSPEKFKGMDAMTVIEQRIDAIIESHVEELVQEWKVKKNEVIFVLNNYKKSAPINVSMDYDSFKETHSLSKLQYKRKVKEVIAALAEKIIPLRNK